MITGKRLEGLAAALLALLAFTGAWAGQARIESLEQLMARLATVKQARASFVEKKHLSELAQPLVVRGTLSYQAPDVLTQHIVSPRDERYAIRGQVIYLKRGGEHRQLVLSQYPALWAYIESLRATLAGDVDALRRFYKVDFDTGATGWVLHLEPRQAGMQKHVESIVLHGSGTELRRVRIEQPNGDYSVMTIHPEATDSNGSGRAER